MKEIKLNVEGMVCGGCEKRVQNAVGDLEGVKKVIASFKEGTVIIKSKEDIDVKEIKETIESLGFEVKE